MTDTDGAPVNFSPTGVCALPMISTASMAIPAVDSMGVDAGPGGANRVQAIRQFSASQRFFTSS